MLLDRMNGVKRTDYCGTLTEGDIGRETVVCGWVQRQRDLGGLIFIDLRDRTGIIQLAFDDTTDKAVFEKASVLRSEYVAMAKGVVRKRSSVNPELPTGTIEIEVTELMCLGAAETPPFEILSDSNANEELRLKYRYLDLRRAPLQNNIMLRHRVVKCTRDYFDENGFIEIETPTLIKSTPEGARDYLVPSRVHKGSFLRFLSRRRCISNCLCCRDLIDICRLPVATVMRICVPTVSLSLHRLIWRCPLLIPKMSILWLRVM